MTVWSYLCCSARVDPGNECVGATIGATKDAAMPQPRNDELMWPLTLHVMSHRGYAGNYHMVHGKEPNGLPLWKSERTNDWVFCGVGGQWFIGDLDEYNQGFVCDTGNIASFEENAGRMPDEIGAGGWLFFDGSEWICEPAINIISEFFDEADQQATIQKNMRHQAATRIQSLYRGNSIRGRPFAQRQKLLDDKESLHRYAVVIQKQMRGSLTRSKLSTNNLGQIDDICILECLLDDAASLSSLSPRTLSMANNKGFISRAAVADAAAAAAASPRPAPLSVSGLSHTGLLNLHLKTKQPAGAVGGGKKEKRQADRSASTAKAKRPSTHNSDPIGR